MKMLKRLRSFAFEHYYAKPCFINISQPIFTFSFDDAPVSSVAAGARILEQHDAKGTYYIASDIKEDGLCKEPFLNDKQIRDLHDRGHDVQCHTCSHLNLRRARPDIYIDDCRRNRHQLTNITGKSAIEHMSYPFGSVSFHCKRNLFPYYKTIRTVEHGVNVGRTDMTYLKTVSLYSTSLDMELVRKAIRQCVTKRGWLIFYTHDVRDDPSPWGITPNEFERIVDLCSTIDGRKILTVSDAYKEIMRSADD